MVNITLTNNSPITIDTELKQKVINSISDYIEKNWDTVVSCEPSMVDDENFPYLLNIGIEL